MTEENDQPVEIAFGIGGDPSHVEIEFADGLQVVPTFVVAELGGPAELEKIATGLSEVTFEQFMEAFYSELTNRKVNRLMADHIARHFEPRFF